ncbi:MAG: hypothetical protein HUU47_09195 [Bacteroidetes bacterium]|nr:hypothetical protein [Bacteroidota bacterium]
MKKTRIFNIVLMVAVMAFSASTLSAQDKNKAKAKANATKIDNFADGRVLSKEDLGFLTAVTKAKGEKSRGANDEVTIDGTTYKVGHVLTSEDLAKISKAIAKSKNGQKTQNKKKSRGDCVYVCYYYLQDAYGYWYYYYYCC